MLIGFFFSLFEQGFVVPVAVADIGIQCELSCRKGHSVVESIRRGFTDIIVEISDAEFYDRKKPFDPEFGATCDRHMASAPGDPSDFSVFRQVYQTDGHAFILFFGIIHEP